MTRPSFGKIVQTIALLACGVACGGQTGGDSAYTIATGGSSVISDTTTGGSTVIIVDAGRPQCLYNGVLYNAGDVFTSSDGCNSCTCEMNNGLTSVGCADDPACRACIQNGQGYPLGAAMTGNVCATCSCQLVSGNITPNCDPVSPCPNTCVYLINAQVFTFDGGTTFPLYPGDCNKCVCDPSTYPAPGYNCPTPHTCPLPNN